jgi:hypothetical protein
MDLEKIEWNSVNWIHVAQIAAVVNTAMSIGRVVAQLKARYCPCVTSSTKQNHDIRRNIKI